MFRRVSSVTITSFPVAFLVLEYLQIHLPDLSVFVAVVGASVYRLSHVTLLVLSLMALPREPYLSVHWTALIPRV